MKPESRLKEIHDGAARAQRGDQPHPAAPAGDPVGDAQQRDGGAPRRQQRHPLLGEDRVAARAWEQGPRRGIIARGCDPSESTLRPTTRRNDRSRRSGGRGASLGAGPPPRNHRAGMRPERVDAAADTRRNDRSRRSGGRGASLGAGPPPRNHRAGMRPERVDAAADNPAERSVAAERRPRRELGSRAPAAESSRGDATRASRRCGGGHPRPREIPRDAPRDQRDDDERDD